MKKKELKKELKKKHFRVAVFGSARIDEKDPRYDTIVKLAEELGKREIDVVTGGGPGLMKAASYGLKLGANKKDTNAKSIGLGIELPWEQRFNKHLDIEKEFHIFSERLDQFMLLSNAIVVAPGGIGTLLELLYAWQLEQVNHICRIPIILLGKQWEELIKWLKKYPLKEKMFKKEDLELLFLANNIEQALKIIDKEHNDFKTGKSNVCLNYKKYKKGLS